MTQERPGAVTFKGEPQTALGPVLKAGDKAPAFTLLANDLSKVSLADSAGKVRLISVVPSLDTGICQQQTKRFNEEAASLPEDAVVYCVSADLPFAQKRFCGAENANKIVALSDHRDMSFGDAYGTHVKELRLDSRAIFVIGKDDTVKHAEYVVEIASHPNYDQALEAVGQALEEAHAGAAR
jgi:thiol peroxidase